MADHPHEQEETSNDPVQQQPEAPAQPTESTPESAPAQPAESASHDESKEALDKEVKKEAKESLSKKKGSEIMRRFRDIAKEKDPAEQDSKKQKLSDEEKEAKHRLVEIRDKLKTLQWDVDHGQINPAMKSKYEKLKKEFMELKQKLKIE